MTLKNPRVALIVAALVCFVIAFAITVNWIHGGNEPAWIAGGLTAFTVAHLP